MNQPAIPPRGDEPNLPARRNRSLISADSLLFEEHGEPENIDLSTIWRILWEKRLIILGAAALGLLLALTYSLLQPPVYRSTATLELNPPTIPILNSSGSGQQDLVVPVTDHEFIETQYGLLQSRQLALNVVESLKLAGDPGKDSQAVQDKVDDLADQLIDNLAVNPVRSSRLVELTYSSPDPQDAARIVNGFAETFVTSTLQRRYDAAASARKFLEARLSEVREELDESERKLVAYAQANGIINTGSDRDSSSDADTLQGASLIALNAALADAQQRRIAAEQRYRNMSGSGSAAEVSERTSALRQERARIQAEYSEKSTYLKDDYPDMVRLRSRIEALDESIKAEAGDVSGSRESTLRSEFQAAAQEERQLQGRVNQLKSAVLNLRERSIQYNILERELDTNRSLYDSLLERYNEIGVAGGINTPQASLVDRGEVPKRPYSPNIPMSIGVGALLGLVVGIGLAFALHYILDRITTPDDIREKLNLPPLGVVPRVERGQSLSEVISDKRSAISEAYASLVSTLQFTTSHGMPRTLLVTSTVAEEGKSTTSFVIAQILAHHGKRVLLLDADLRKPSFIIEESSDIGFSQLVVNGGGILHHTVKTSEENLWLMPSGPPPPNPVQMLNSKNAAAAIEEARNFFDYVIIDAPPTFGFADAQLLASMCDAVLLVIESGRTRRRPAIEVIARLRATGALIVGAALTKYRSSAVHYGYHYYQTYGDEPEALEAHELTVGLIKREEE